MESAYYRNLFLDEISPRLSLVSERLARLATEFDDLETLADVFREVHSLKGNASAVGYHRLAELAHAMEDVLQGLRDRVLPPEPRSFALLLSAWERLRQIVARPDEERGADFSALLSELRAVHAQASAAAAGPAATEAAWPARAVFEPNGPVQRYEVVVTLDDSCLFRSARVLMVIAQLELLGTVLNVSPSLAEIEAVETLQEFKLELLTAVAATEITADLAEMAELSSVLVKRLEHLGPGAPGLATGGPTRVRAEDFLAGFVPWVRDTAAELGKEVSFHVEGADLWLEGGRASGLADIVVHLLRNALDHGVETPEQRLNSVKPRTARISVSLLPDGACLRLRVEDDGKGLDFEAIRRRAISSGQLSQEQALAADAVLLTQLIWQAGFSTAAQITSVSGRGVGLDAVKHRVENLNGQLEIQSAPGKGTIFQIRFPLTDSPA